MAIFRVSRFRFLMAALMVCELVQGASAAVVVWGTERALTGAAADIAVDASGTVVQAVSFGVAGPNQNVAGIDFKFVATTGLSAIGDPGVESSNPGPGVFWSNTTDDLAPILLGQAYGGPNAPGGGMALTLSGLAPGTHYAIQLLMSDVRVDYVRPLDLDGDLATAEITDYTFGRTIVGEFTADGATQIVNLLKPSPQLDGQGQMGAYVLTSVPEPTSLALVGLGGALVLRRRRQA
jgi:hypothetical protein